MIPHRLWAVVKIATRRLLAQPGLTLATVIGLVVVVTLTMSIPLYADAIYYRVFFEDVLQPDARARPPFALMFQYRGSWHGLLQWEDIQQVDQYLTEVAPGQISLPEQLRTQHVTTEPLRLYTRDETIYSDRNVRKWASVAYVRYIEDHITLLEGRLPADATPQGSEPVEVLASEELALEIGLQVGEEYLIYAEDRSEDNLRSETQIPVRIAGVWRAKSPEDDFWFIHPQFLADQLLVSEETFAGRVSAALPDEIHTATWYMVMDGSNLSYDASRILVSQLTDVEQIAGSLLPNTRLEISPRTAIRDYQAATELLTIQLLVLSVPIIGLLLGFVVLTTALAVERQRNEIAVLRSRGATARQIVGVASVEGMLLGLLALVISTPLSLIVASLIGRSRSFLDFTGAPGIQVNLSVTALLIGVATIVFAMIAQVIPTLANAKYTITTYKQSQARSLRPALWQRLWLDVWLLFPTAYGIYLLTQQGSIVKDRVDTGALADNPLLFLVPALAILTATLLVLRLMPLLFRLFSWLMALSNRVAILMAARQLARAPGLYSAPMALLIATLSLSSFTASLAQTLDTHLKDRSYYQVGADLEFFEFGEAVDLGLTVGGSASASQVQWRFLPVDEYRRVSGVNGSARVGQYEASFILEGQQHAGQYLGIDWFDFSKVTFWRADFASAPLNSLMNALAQVPDGVLVPASLMQENDLQLADTLRMTVRMGQRQTALDLKIAGTFELFPTWYPSDGPLFVGNLDYLFEQAGGGYPYYVWIDISAGADPHDLRTALMAWQESPLPAIESATQSPERQGLFGLLSIGFGAAAVLSVIGFLLYVLFSFRRRMIEMGVMRALGLSTKQMTVLLLWELLSLILLGALIGTGIGASASRIFIPFLQIGSSPVSLTPPFNVQIAWFDLVRIYSLLSLLFVIALVGLAFMLRRMRIFQAIKLGETI